MSRDYVVSQYARATRDFQIYFQVLYKEIFPDYLGRYNYFLFPNLLGWKYSISIFENFVGGTPVEIQYAKFIVPRTRRLGRIVLALKRIIKKRYIKKFLNTTNKALGDKPPKDFLVSDAETKKVLNLISCVESGSFS